MSLRIGSGERIHIIVRFRVSRSPGLRIYNCPNQYFAEIYTKEVFPCPEITVFKGIQVEAETGLGPMLVLGLPATGSLFFNFLCPGPKPCGIRSEGSPGLLYSRSAHLYDRRVPKWSERYAMQLV